MPTYSTAVWSPSYSIVFELQVRVEDGCVKGNFAVEAAAELLPVRCRFGHCDFITSCLELLCSRHAWPGGVGDGSSVRVASFMNAIHPSPSRPFLTQSLSSRIEILDLFVPFGHVYLNTTLPLLPQEYVASNNQEILATITQLSERPFVPTRLHHATCFSRLRMVDEEVRECTADTSTLCTWIKDCSPQLRGCSPKAWDL